jgi:hypothetical protein
MRAAIRLLTWLLILSSVATAQTSTKKVTVIYNDGAKVELNSWFWYYQVDKSNNPRVLAVNNISSFLKSGDDIYGPTLDLSKKSRSKGKDVPTQPRLISRPSYILFLDMSSLHSHGVSLQDVEISDSEITSIKFLWDTSVAKKEIPLKGVVISRANGKTIELPYLAPSHGYRYISLEGATKVDGMWGNFLEYVSERYVFKPDEPYIVEIKFQ